MRKHVIAGAFAAAALAMTATGASAQSTLRIGLAEDPDILDPTMARTYVGRIVFASTTSCSTSTAISTSCRSLRSNMRPPRTG
jgi:hypothetical protein